MSAFTRNLKFSSKDLGQETTLLFTFDDLASNPSLFKNQYPVCWRVTTFGASGPYSVSLTYKNQLAFTRPQINSDKVIGASTYTDINEGQKTVLTVDASDVPTFSAPVKEKALKEGMFRAENDTGSLQDVVVGFHNDPANDPVPALLFENIGDGSNVTAQFTPVLRLYVTSDYQETAIIRAAIQSNDFVWSQNLSQLTSQSSGFSVTRDEAGHYKVKQT